MELELFKHETCHPQGLIQNSYNKVISTLFTDINYYTSKKRVEGLTFYSFVYFITL